MTQPELLFSNDINIITQVDVSYASSGASNPTSINYTYTHSPIPSIIIILVVLIIVFDRLIIEFLIRWRKKDKKI